MRFHAGQNVYTATEVRGWFDHSVKSAIPANTIGTIQEVHTSDQETKYLVKFHKEFGSHLCLESQLKLG